MIYGYARVSTALEKTKDRNQTFDRQLMILKEKGVKEENIFCDRITGGSNTKDREAFDKLLSVILPGDTIIVSEMSRLSRSLRNLIDTVNYFMSHQIGITFIKEGFVIGTDGMNPVNKLLFQIIGAVNEFEKSLIAERVSQGMQASKQKGKVLGRPQKTSPEIKDEIISRWLSGIDYKTLSAQYNLSIPTLVSICHPYKDKRNWKTK